MDDSGAGPPAMIAFACSVSEVEPFTRYAGPGLRAAAEPDSPMLVFAAMDTIGRSYNLLLDAAAQLQDLEALVLVHPHAEIVDPDCCAKLRAALSSSDVAVVGCVGASQVRSIAWWEGAVSCGPVTTAYTDFGGGRFPAFSWTGSTAAPAEVEAVDGFVMALSPWAVENLRFDEELVLGHGYDVDLCLQARAAGRRVVTSDLRVIEHRSLDIISDIELWVESHIAVSCKWGAQLDPGPSEPELPARQRARRAEADRECARATAYFNRLGYDARVEALERSLQTATSTPSWRLTKPLRRLNQWRRDRAQI
ncbi:MAG: glycosyltransferase [Solirubrobacteraceae bacterium]